MSSKLSLCKVVGDPVTAILKSFSKLYPNVSVKIAYSQGIDAIHSMPPKNKYEAKSIFNINPQVTEESSILPIDDRDWSTGALMSLMRRGDDFVILLDWEAAIADNVAILLEMLPRLVTNEYTEEEAGQYEYKVAKRRLISDFTNKLNRHYNSVIPKLIKSPDSMQVLHTPFTELESELNEVDTTDYDDENDDDACFGGV
jgi:hypothetical protein